MKIKVSTSWKEKKKAYIMKKNVHQWCTFFYFHDVGLFYFHDVGLTSCSFFLAASISSRLFWGFFSRKQKFRKTFPCCQQKKQSNSRCWCCFFVCANLYCSEKSFHQQRKTKRNWLFPLLILFACFFLLFLFFWREKKKLYRKKTRKKKRYIPKTCMIKTAKKLRKTKKNVVSTKKPLSAKPLFSGNVQCKN